MVYIDKILHNEFLKVCISHYLKTYAEGMNLTDRERFGNPPESILIAIGTSHKNDDWHPLVSKEAVYRYSKRELKKADIDTVPDHTGNGMYFKEAYAELCYNNEGTAFMMIQYGKRYIRCYRYNIKTEDGRISFADEKLLWVS